MINSQTVTGKTETTLNPLVMVLSGIFFGLWIGRADFAIMHLPGLTFKNLTLLGTVIVLLWHGRFLKSTIPGIFFLFTLLLVFCTGIRWLNLVLENAIIYSVVQSITNWYLALGVVFLLLKMKFDLDMLAMLLRWTVITFSLCTLAWFSHSPDFCYNEIKHRFYPCNVDPNEFCMYASFAIFNGLWALRRLGKRDFPLLAAIITLGVAAALTVSRSGYIGLLLALLLCRLFVKRRKNNSWLFFIVLLAGAVVLMSYIFIERLGYSELFSRLNFEGEVGQGEIQQYSSGRLEIWNSYIDSLRGSPWIGYLSAEYITCTLIPFEFESNTLYMPHNLILTYMVLYGIPLAVFAIFVIFQIGAAFFRLQKQRPDLEAYLPGCGYVGICATSMALSHDITFLLTLFVLVIGKLQQATQEKEITRPKSESGCS